MGDTVPWISALALTWGDAAAAAEQSEQEQAVREALAFIDRQFQQKPGKGEKKQLADQQLQQASLLLGELLRRETRLSNTVVAAEINKAAGGGGIKGCNGTRVFRQRQVLNDDPTAELDVTGTGGRHTFLPAAWEKSLKLTIVVRVSLSWRGRGG